MFSWITLPFGVILVGRLAFYQLDYFAIWRYFSWAFGILSVGSLALKQWGICQIYCRNATSVNSALSGSTLTAISVKMVRFAYLWLQRFSLFRCNFASDKNENRMKQKTENRIARRLVHGRGSVLHRIPPPRIAATVTALLRY